MNLKRDPIWIVILAAIAIVFVVAIGRPSVPARTPPAAAAPASASASASAVPTGPLMVFGNGTYKVGTGAGQVPPGEYSTPGGTHCFCAQFKGDADSRSVIPGATDVSNGGPIVMVVQTGADYLTVIGDCLFMATD